MVMVMASMSHLMKIFAFNPLFLLLLLFVLVILISRCIIVLVQWISMLFGNIVRVHDWSVSVSMMLMVVVVRHMDDRVGIHMNVSLVVVVLCMIMLVWGG